MLQRVLLVLVIMLSSNLFDLQAPSASEVVDYRRPIYNIAHMVNSIPEVSYYLNKGANAIESDVTFQKDGAARWVFHGTPCDCLRHCDYREELSTFFDHIREISTPGHPKFRPEFVFFFLDLKVSDLPAKAKARAGETLAFQLLHHLWKQDLPQSQVYVLLSIGHTSDYEVVKAVRETLGAYLADSFIKERIGWDIGLNDKLPEIDAMWNRLDVSGNVWLGDGITNCLSYLSTNRRLRQALNERKNNNRFSKVYRWTVDYTFSLKFTLRLGVDGIITNHPERLVSILKEPEFSTKLRLANIDDNPWNSPSIVKGPGGKNRPNFSSVVNVAKETVGSFWKFLQDGSNRVRRILP